MVHMRLLLSFCLVFWMAACGSDTQGSHTLGGQVTGLKNGNLILGSADGQSITVTQNTSFVLPKALASGTPYSVFVLSAPTGQSCTIDNATGLVASRDITDLNVSCSLAFGFYNVGGTIQGLSQSQSSGLVLSQGQEKLIVAADGVFSFALPLADLTPYAVGIAALPVGQNCQIQNAQGYINAAHIEDIQVLCAPSPGIFVTIAVSGLVQDPNAATDALRIDDIGALPALSLLYSNQTPQAQRLAKSYTYAAPYSLKLNAPSGMRCTWDRGGRPTDPTVVQGVVTGNTSLSVSCAPLVTYTLSLEVAGINAGTLLATNQQSTDVNNPLAFDLAPTAAKSFAYAYTPQQAYNVVTVAPPGQTCVPTAHSPALNGLMSDNTTISMVCSPSPARLAVGVSGVTRGSVSVSNGLSQDANNPLEFTTANPNSVLYYAHSYTAGEVATLSLSANQLACYFAENGATTFSPTLQGDAFVAVRCAETIP